MWQGWVGRDGAIMKGPKKTEVDRCVCYLDGDGLHEEYICMAK